MSSKKRVEMALRLQAYEGDITIQVFEYLKSLPEDERRQRVKNILMAAFLPYALYQQGECDFKRLRYTCWESHSELSKHCSYMRLALGVEQPQFVFPNQFAPQFLPATMMSNNNGVSIQPQENTSLDSHEEDEEDESCQPESAIKGKGTSADVDRIFGD